MTERDIVNLRRREWHETDGLVDAECSVIVDHCVGDIVHVKCQVEAFIGRLEYFIQCLDCRLGHNRSGLVHEYQIVLVLDGSLNIERIE